MDGPQRTGGLALVVLGLALVAAGALWHFGLLSWFGRLPGDIRIENERTRVYIPLTSMVLVSVLLSLAMYLWNRFR